jgi:hypothetical protein
MTGNDDDTGRGPTTKHTTRPQPHEQLLVGWIAGGSTTTTTVETEGDGGDAATTITASSCLQIGQEGGETITRGSGQRREKRDDTNTRPRRQVSPGPFLFFFVSLLPPHAYEQVR